MTDDGYSLLPPPSPPPPKKEREHSPSAFCNSCGYNLRGIPVSRPCPECGTPYVDRQFNDRLRYANPRWTLNLAWGALFLATGIGASLLLLAVIFLQTYSEHEEFNKRAYLALSAIELLGILLLTTKEPARVTPEKRVPLRSVLRAFALVVFMLELLSIVDLFQRILPSPLRSADLSTILPYAAAIAMVRALLIAYHVRSLAIRIPDTHTARQMVYITWCLCIWGVASGIFCITIPQHLMLWIVFSAIPVIFVSFLRWVAFWTFAMKLRVCIKKNRRPRSHAS